MHVFWGMKLEPGTWMQGILLLSEWEEFNGPELVSSGLESNVRQQPAVTCDVPVWQMEEWIHSLRSQTFIPKPVLSSSKYLGLHNLVSHQVSWKSPWKLPSNSKLKTSWELYSFIDHEESCIDHGSPNLIPCFEQQ